MYVTAIIDGSAFIVLNKVYFQIKLYTTAFDDVHVAIVSHDVIVISLSTRSKQLVV